MANVLKTGVSLTPDIAAKLDERGPRSTIIQRDLSRLYSLYERSLPRFTPDEAYLIVDALNGTLIDVAPARALALAVEDAIELEGLAEKWNVDGPTLVAKLNALNDTEAFAVVDAAERVWNRDTLNEFDATVKALFRL